MFYLNKFNVKIVVNASVLISGGGVQVALSLINEFKYFNHQYVIITSSAVSNQIRFKEFDESKFTFVNIPVSPSSVLNRSKVVNCLNEIVLDYKPDIVFTVFGPSYWKPRNIPHLCGFALPWMINPENPIFDMISLYKRLYNFVISKYKWYHFKKEVDYLWCETNDVKERISRYYNFSLSNIYCFGNTYASHFKRYINDNEINPIVGDPVMLLTVSAFYPHKNIEIIKNIIPFLSSRISFKFCLTIPNDVFNRIFSVKEKEYIINYGPVSNIDCPRLYDLCDCVFLPTFLECFSANYPEAMIMRKPILTSDLDFAHDICQDAALYFDPLDAKDIAEKIMKLASDNNLYRELQIKGLRRVKDFPSAAERAEQILNICEKIVKQNSNV